MHRHARANVRTSFLAFVHVVERVVATNGSLRRMNYPHFVLCLQEWFI
jgi:hypothetical protein